MTPIIYDADNEKGAKETVEVTIKGLFDGHNKSAVTYHKSSTKIQLLQTSIQLLNYTATQKKLLFMRMQLLCNSGQELG